MLEEIVLDLVAVEHGVVGEDLLEEHPQLGYVPLPVAEVVDELPDRLLGGPLEGVVEALVGGEDLQVGVQHHQRLAHGLDDVLGVFPGVLDFRLQLLACGDVLHRQQDDAGADLPRGRSAGR